MSTTEELQRELADASRVIGALISKLDQANETIEGLEATIGSLRHERDRERLAHAKSWDAMSARIARMEEAGDSLKEEAWPTMFDTDETRKRRYDAMAAWTAAKEAKP